MRIKKIELVGFKSFKDRTVIQFDAGITGIVGPNGCGKSNIVDALVWVMGEMSAKDLRGSTMTDVIFAGADGYAPLGMCEVSLTLENDGGPFPAKYIKHSEIMVTRRLHRNGEGEYLINKEAARLKDVQEIFMDTGAGSKGFSIIQQGMIGKIITAKPEDRRHLIEEAAGITKFKARKKESQRKLQNTDQNLVRLQDIIGELKRQIDSLQRQAQKAERYRTVKQQIEELELWVSSRQFADLRQGAEEAQRIFNECQSIEIESGSQVSGLQADFEELKLRLLEEEKSLEIQQQAHFDKQTEVQRREMEIQQLKFEIETARKNEQMTGSLLSEQKARLELLEKDHAQLSTQMTEAQTLAQSLKASYEEKNSIYAESSDRIQTVDQELTTERRSLFALGQSISTVEAKVSSLESMIGQQNEKITEELSVQEELQLKTIEFEGRRKKIIQEFDRERQLQLDLASDVDSFEANKKILSEQVQLKKTEIDLFKDELNKVTSRLYGLESLHSNFEGFDEGVKKIMLWQKSRKTQEVHADGSVSSSEEGYRLQPLSEIIEVPSEYEIAMEAALGSRLQLLVGESATDSMSALDYLKNEKQGRGSFISSEMLAHDDHSKADVSTRDGFVAHLASVVNSSEKHQALVQQVLGKIVVVDSMMSALEMRKTSPNFDYVTMDGDVISSDGIMTGGFSEDVESGVLQRKREIKELSDLKSEWAGKLALAQAALKKVEEQLNNVINDFEGAQKRKLEQEVKVAELKAELQRAETEYQNVIVARDRQNKEVIRLQDHLNHLTSQQETLQSELEGLRARRFELDSKIEQLSEELSSTKLGFEGLQNQVRELQVQSATKEQEYLGLERQVNMLFQSISELKSQSGRMSEESEMYVHQMTESQYKLEEKKIEFEKALSSIESTKLELSAKKNQFEIESQRLKELESQLSESQRSKNMRQAAMNEAQLKLEQARMKEQYLIDQMREKYMIDLSSCYEQHLQTERNEQETEITLKDLKEKISRIGEVNLSAIQEYDDVSKRYEFLSQQYNDLIEAKEQLRRVIERINKICSKKFKETFDLVNERFKKVFPVLFGGGEAELILVEDPEKSEMGIEIIAKPPGKKMQNVSLMSGGEKALTAVSLVFSIFLVKPSPYCLLDEVDAPLDDANVYRFNELVKEMAKRSQIIVVTHNKHTMEVAGRLYGVTMQERGVSTMVSVSLQDLQ